MTLLHLPHLLSPPDREARQGGEYAMRTGRSWWALRYTDGRIVHEWDPDPGSPNGHCDWPRMPKKGRQALRLYCPNGKMVQLGETADASGRLFQFKVARRDTLVAIGVGPIEESEHIHGHVVGIVTGLDGQCVLYAWEPLPPPEIPAETPKRPNEQEWIAKHAEPGLYEKAVVQWERDLDEFMQTPLYRDWERRFQAWESNAKGRLVGPIEDNVYRLAYNHCLPVAADHLGIDDGEGR